MKIIKSALCSAILAGAVFSAPSVVAAPVVNVNAYDSHFTARVSSNGMPVAGAMVKVHSGLESMMEGVTDSHGMVRFYPVSNSGTYKAVAETSEGTSEPRWFSAKHD